MLPLRLPRRHDMDHVPQPGGIGGCGGSGKLLDTARPNAKARSMENVILVIHLLLALSLIGVVLLQRSEGGGLGMGGGGGGGVMTGRGAATALGKLTWLLAVAFIATSITLTILAAQKSADSSVMDRLGDEEPAATEPAPALPGTGDLLPPSADEEPLSLPRAE